MIRASANNGRLLFVGLTGVNLQRLTTGGDEGVGRPMRFSLGTFVPPETTTQVGEVEVIVFYASRQSIVELGKALDQDVKGMLDQLGEG